LAKDEEKAVAALNDALAAVRDVWELEATARNPRLIREAREQRSENTVWQKGIEEELQKRTKE
jgi:hypothetical protein